MGRLRMITGYNTDVRHRGLVFHVQTEDKGLANPCIESLVYVGGQILHRRRSDYAQLVKDGGGKSAILEKLEAQHRKLIAEIRTGALDGEAESKIGPLTGPAAPRRARPAPAGAAAAPTTAPSPSLDQVILDYLNMEAEQEYLILVMDSMGELKLGSDALLAFHAKASTSGKAVKDAEVAVKLISTVAEPRILGSGATNADGNLNLRVAIPRIDTGTAALIITAESDLGTAEIKHLI